MLSVMDLVDLIVEARQLAEERDYHGVAALLSDKPMELLKLEPELGHLLAQAYSHVDETAACARVLAELELCCAHHGNDRLYRRRLNLLAVGAMREGRLADAESLLCQVAEASLEASDDTFLATAMMNLGVIADMRCAWDRAASHYRQALVLFQRVGDRASMAGCYHNLGMLSRQRGRVEEAELHYRRALENYKTSGTAEERASTAMEIALLASDNGDVEWGAAMAAKCLKSAHRMANRRLIGEAFRVSGLINLRRNLVREAHSDLCAGLRVERKNPNPMLRAELYEALAALYQVHSCSSAAQTYRTSAIATYKAIGLLERANTLIG